MRWTTCVIATVVLGTALSGAAARAQEPAGAAAPRVEPFEHLTAPRIALPDDPRGASPLRQLCPEVTETCRKYWDYTINFVGNYTIPLRDKELLILRTAWLSRGDYIWGRHNVMGQEAGLTPEEIARVTVGPDAAGWSTFDALLLRAADELHTSRFVSDETWAGLATRYSESDLRELVLIVGNYTQLAMFQNTLGAQLPADVPGLPATGRLLVLLRDASALAIVHPQTGDVEARIPTGRDPHEVTATPDGTRAFVASMVDGISVIDLVTRTEIARIDPGPGSQPHDLLYVDGKIYFTIEGYRAIGRLDPWSHEIDWTLGVGEDGTHMLALDRRTDTLFMPNTRSNTISVAEGISDGPGGARLSVIDVPGPRPEGLDLSPDGRELWTATRDDGNVSIIDIGSRTVMRTLELGLKDANRLKFTPDGRVLIIDGEAAELVVLDGSSRSELARVSMGETDTGDGAVLVGRGGRRAYVGLRAADRVAVVDLETLEVTQQIPMGQGAGPGCLFWIDAIGG